MNSSLKSNSLRIAHTILSSEYIYLLLAVVIIE